MLPMIALGVLVGGASGTVLAITVHRRRRSTAFQTPPEAIAPTRFEVVVDRDRDRARHRLARWWDPTAPPAGSQQPD
jgi:hypothetical protein